ncbi:hypothetical protein GCK72_001750 [Caenorhabditis remanei]|uniref:Uncharacterized protein n=1 Tax=Caenorhabditis remanei TaxID=31234 RepID=A0A6A5HUL6_CAERE|nr:hypothetical protein GCK72_001750 [Caenorhabditis remanei]KAF1769933.1 hypothetical protein GCK72_001750 [Caenorhabditis remanei]
MVLERKRQGVISGSITWKNREYIEIFDRDYKYLYGEVEDLFIAYGSWVEYDIIDASVGHPKNCFKEAINVNMDVKKSNAPTTDEFGKTEMKVRDFNKVDFFQYNTEGGQLTHKSTVRCNIATGNYFNEYYGDVIDVMLNLIPSDKYCGNGPHWEVTHFINQGKMYSINGYLSILGLVLRGPGGVVRNRSDVTIPPDSLRPIRNDRDQRVASPESNWENSITTNVQEKNKNTNIAIKEIEANNDQWKTQSASTNSSAEPVNSIKPRGLAGFGAFGAFGATNPTVAAPTTEKREMCGVQNSTSQKPLVATTHSRLVGFGRSSGSFGVADNPQRFPPEFRANSGCFAASSGTFGSETRVKAPVQVINDDDFETPELASDTSRIHTFEKIGSQEDQKNTIPDKTSAAKKLNENDFDDDWGEESASTRSRVPQRQSNIRLPPQSKKPGLSKYSNSNF